MSASLLPIIGHGRRASVTEARRAFQSGNAVMVHETGEAETLPVTRITTTHHARDGITWPVLLEMVNMWRNRYPGQTFYVVTWEELT